jgi:hypothetical protein
MFFKKKNKRHKGEQKFRHQYQQGDFFLAEFPKSGVTWLATLTASLESTFLSRDESLVATGKDPFGYGRRTSFVSDDSLDVELCPVRSEIFGGRVIKTHSECQLHHQRCVYLYRHPGHVMVSYWSMLRAAGVIEEKLTLEEFCLHPSYGLGAWKRHIHSWIHLSSYVAVITFLSYEQLCSDTVGCLKKILSIFGKEVSEVQLTKAVDASERSNMLQAERLAYESDIRRSARFNKDYYFVGNSGRSSSLAKTIEPMIRKLCKEEMDLLYP